MRPSKLRLPDSTLVPTMSASCIAPAVEVGVPDDADVFLILFDRAGENTRNLPVEDLGIGGARGLFVFGLRHFGGLPKKE